VSLEDNLKIITEAFEQLYSLHCSDPRDSHGSKGETTFPPFNVTGVDNGKTTNHR